MGRYLPIMYLQRVIFRDGILKPRMSIGSLNFSKILLKNMSTEI